MTRPTALFLTRLFTNEFKDSFSAHLGSTLILGKFNLAGPIASALGFLLRSVIGFLMETGIYKIDLTLDALKEGQKQKQFEKDALEAYKKATKKVYSEEEKNAIRAEYLKIISAIGNVGSPK